MTKREEYDLVFYKSIDPIDNSPMYILSTNTPSIATPFSNLAIISMLEKEEIEYLIENISWAQSDLIYDPGFLEQQNLDGQDVVFEKPNFTLDTI